jgi:hypothetical protein
MAVFGLTAVELAHIAFDFNLPPRTRIRRLNLQGGRKRYDN